MKKLFVTLLTLSFLSLSTIAGADEGVIKPMKLGELAPFEGLLLSPSAVAEIVSDKKLESERIAVAVDSERKKTESGCQLRLGEEKIRFDREVAYLNSDIKMKEARLTTLSEQLRISQEKEGMTPYYVGGGVLAGTLLTILTTIAITHISN